MSTILAFRITGPAGTTDWQDAGRKDDDLSMTLLEMTQAMVQELNLPITFEYAYAAPAALPEAIRAGVAIIKRIFIGAKPSIDLPADSFIQQAVEQIIAERGNDDDYVMCARKLSLAQVINVYNHAAGIGAIDELWKVERLWKALLS
jgi:hypothetical protein